MKTLAIDPLKPVFEVTPGHNIFRQLAVKVDMDGVSDDDYFSWLDCMIRETSAEFRGVKFIEKEGVRTNPPLNTAVYYDTADYKLLPTGALLRTSCNKVTHAFCAFKMPEDESGNRLDRRHVFEGAEKLQIQTAPFSKESIAIVKRLLARTDIEQPGTFLQREYGIPPDAITPAVVLFGHRSTFYVRLDDYDVLRCSIDRSEVMDNRNDPHGSAMKAFREVEISIYPRIRKEISGDSRIIQLIRYLTDTLTTRFSRPIIHAIKYQRAAMALGILGAINHPTS